MDFIFHSYVNITIATLITGILASNPNINIILTFVFPFVIAALYLEKKFMIYSYIIIPVNVLCSIYLTLKAEFPLEYTDMLSSYMIAYVLELAVMIMIFSLLSKRVVGLFNNLVDSNEQKRILDSLQYAQGKSSEISETLHSSLVDLNGSVESSAATNEAIAQNAGDAELNSISSMDYVKNESMRSYFGY